MPPITNKKLNIKQVKFINLKLRVEDKDANYDCIIYTPANQHQKALDVIDKTQAELPDIAEIQETHGFNDEIEFILDKLDMAGIEWNFTEPTDIIITEGV